MSHMRVSPKSLAGAAQSVDRCATEVGGELQSLGATVTTESPWGNDEQGSLFGAAYAEVLNHALETYGSHVELLYTAGEGLAQWAQRSAEAEHGVNQQISVLGTQLGV